MTTRVKYIGGLLAAPLRNYCVAVAVVVLALACSLALSSIVGPVNTSALLVAAVAICALHGGIGPGVATTILVTFVSSAENTGTGSAILLVAGLAISVLIGLLQRRLRAAEEALHARDDLLAVAAHELKTPLTIIIGYTQTLQMRAARHGHLSRRDQDTLRVIAGQAKRLHRLIESLLDLASLQHGQLKIEQVQVDIAALARHTVDDIALTATQHTIAVHTPDAPLLITGDALRLEQVLWNLLQNAIKYSPKGGEIHVQVERRDREALLRISDQGIGISEDEQGQLFQRFYRAGSHTAQRIRGVGLGLSIVQEIVTRHGGVVEVVSAEGRGSIFTVRLPLGALLQDSPGGETEQRKPLPVLPGQEAPLVTAGREERRQ